jgi:hypothetical protein
MARKKQNNPASSIQHPASSIEHPASSIEPPITILTFTPVWKRPAVFEICLKGIDRLVKYAPARFNIIPFFIVSESWAAKAVLARGYQFIMMPNSPLGAKKNIGMKYAFEEFQFDYLMEIGSDDILTNQYLDIIEPLCRTEVAEFCISTCHFIDTITGAVALWKTDKVLGLGRCISRPAIAKVLRTTTLWGNERERGMDTYSWRQLQAVGVENTLIENDTVLGVDIKSEVNINPISKFTPINTTPENMLKNIPEAPEIIKLIKK